MELVTYLLTHLTISFGVGVLFTLVVGGLVWGALHLYRMYKIKQFMKQLQKGLDEVVEDLAAISYVADEEACEIETPLPPKKPRKKAKKGSKKAKRR